MHFMVILYFKHQNLTSESVYVDKLWSELWRYKEIKRRLHG
jgi:hypothetical protein